MYLRWIIMGLCPIPRQRALSLWNPIFVVRIGVWGLPA